MADGDDVTIRLMFFLCLYWQMLLPFVFVAVGIATFDHQLYQKVYHCCYYFLMADVVVRMADGVAMFMIGRCCCHVADVFATIL